MFYFLYERRIGRTVPVPTKMANQTRLKYHPRQEKEVNPMDFSRYPHVCTIVLLAALAG